MKKSEPDNSTENSPEKPQQPARQGRLQKLMWGIPLGWQLSTLYALLLVITLTLVGSLVYSQQQSFLVQDVAQRLSQEVSHIVNLPSGNDQSPRPNDGDHGSNDPGYHPPPDGDYQANSQTRLISNLLRGLQSPDVTVAILDTTGTVLTYTQALEGDSPSVVQPVTAEQIATALASDRYIQFTDTRSDGTPEVTILQRIQFSPPNSTQGGSRELSQTSSLSAAPTLTSAMSTGATQSLTQTGTITLLVQQSASLAAVDSALERLRTYLLLGGLGGTLLGIILVLAFTRGVLRPLDRVADTADAIASGDMKRRLQLPSGRNEVARLGKAFDYMVGRLVAALEAQRRFIADASHELRTPLTSLKGLAEILVIGAHGGDSRVIEQAAQSINSELDRMIRLVTDLLTLSRLNDTGSNSSPTARHARMDVCSTVGAAASQMVQIAESRDVSIDQHCSGPLWIMGDAGQIKQVLLNLVDNALRYTPMGGSVTLSVKSEANSARIEVADTGSGIAERDLPHIFERFYRGDSSRSRATGNSGLGLAIVKEIVEAHGGTIDVTSTPKVGTTFTILLPLAKARAPKEELAEATARA